MHPTPEILTRPWTGSEMIVWGGCPRTNTDLIPAGDTIPARIVGQHQHRQRTRPDSNIRRVWTASEMIVWGGGDLSHRFNTGGKYNASTDSWTATNTTNAPSARISHTAAWTGSEMIVWGGTNYSSDFDTGGRYDPGMDSWRATSTTKAPSGRYNHAAVWTGTEMIVWGGAGDSDSEDLNTGGRVLRATGPTPAPHQHQHQHQHQHHRTTPTPNTSPDSYRCRGQQQRRSRRRQRLRLLPRQQRRQPQRQRLPQHLLQQSHQDQHRRPGRARLPRLGHDPDSQVISDPPSPRLRRTSRWSVGDAKRSYRKRRFSSGVITSQKLFVSFCLISHRIDLLGIVTLAAIERHLPS
jgi:hypothetical protein